MKRRLTNGEWRGGPRNQLRRLAALPFVILHSPFVAVFCFSAAAETSNDAARLRPPYAELPPTFWEQHGSAVILGAIAVLFLAALAAWLALRPRPVPLVPPELQARRALDALQGRPEDGALLSEVSQILRRYFVAAFGLPAGEFTTTEFCKVIGDSEAFGAELSSAVVKFLESSDVRKFAPLASAGAMNAVAEARELFERAEARRAQLAAAQNKASA